MQVATSGQDPPLQATRSRPTNAEVSAVSVPLVTPWPATNAYLRACTMLAYVHISPDSVVCNRNTTRSFECQQHVGHAVGLLLTMRCMLCHACWWCLLQLLEPSMHRPNHAKCPCSSCGTHMPT